MQTERKPKFHSQTITPEPRPEHYSVNQNTPSTPGIYQPFNWEDFEARYERALADADNHEREVLSEFDRLVKVGHRRQSPSRFLHLLTWPDSTTTSGRRPPLRTTTNALLSVFKPGSATSHSQRKECRRSSSTVSPPTRGCTAHQTLTVFLQTAKSCGPSKLHWHFSVTQLRKRPARAPPAPPDLSRSQLRAIHSFIRHLTGEILA